MRSPFRSESAAFHFLLLTVGAFGVVAAASAVGGALPALVAWGVVSAGAVAIYAHGRERRTPQPIDHVGPADERRIVVVAPLAASPLHRLASDVDVEEDLARRRADAVAARLRAVHVLAASAVGDDAVDDTLRLFGGDEIVVLPGDDSLAGRLRERYAVPVAELDA